METADKLKLTATQMHLEPAEEVGSQIAPCGQVLPKDDLPAKKSSLGIFNAAMGGKTVPILKTMLTSACERDCYYCPFRAGRSYRRTTFKPEEMAQTVSDMNRAGLINGLFLSSGIIKGGLRTQDKLIETAEILRQKHQFKGYLHLKIMPGAEEAQVERAMQLVDRLSINLEAPNEKRLAALAPKKEFFAELLKPLQWVEQIRRSQEGRKGWNGRWPSTVTQFVVGAAGESDLELLQTAEYLYQELRLRRTYFSAFSPILNTPLENLPAENPLRQHRLYQASFLFRDYGFDLEEMPFDQWGNLPLLEDPKLAWAQAELLENPLEVNRASRDELLRVPGIGPKSAQVIVQERRHTKVRDLQDLRAIGVQTKRMEPFVLVDGKRPLRQLRLF
ncbi:MAG: radical SAM protein [Ardenticatenaceae bacterium]|nr:radical SAM protein [Ardenticatenaceae bacterium]